AKGDALPLGAALDGASAEDMATEIDTEMALANGALMTGELPVPELAEDGLLDSKLLGLDLLPPTLSGEEPINTDALVSGALSLQPLSQQALAAQPAALNQAADGQAYTNAVNAAMLQGVPGSAAEASFASGRDVANKDATANSANTASTNISNSAQGAFLAAAEEGEAALAGALARELAADNGKLAGQSPKEVSLGAQDSLLANDPRQSLDPRQHLDPRQGFDIRQDDVVTTWLDEQTDSALELKSAEFKPVEFKPFSPSHGANGQGAGLRPELTVIPLSLRQGTGPTPLQEMIQRFSPVMQQQLITMVSQGLQQAEIRLDPPELGHMLVKIQVQGDQTQVQFHVTQSQTRELVEQALPRLRELLLDQGMQLADSHVSQGDQGQRREGGFAKGDEPNMSNLDDFSAEELDLGLNQSISLTSGIDYYA
ncbi:MAG: flagellar hook-length control protein FliK, partial [Shewanella sp.]